MTDSTPDSPTIQIQLLYGYKAIVDDCDSDLARFKWSPLSSERLYAVKKIYVERKNKCEYMHRMIMERMIGRPLVKGEDVDHINRNKLDNRRCNLRIATRTQNNMNCGPRSNNKCGYKGVFWHEKKWTTVIKVGDKRIRLGRFDDIKDAARAYNAAALKYYGEFAWLNPIEAD